MWIVKQLDIDKNKANIYFIWELEYHVPWLVIGRPHCTATLRKIQELSLIIQNLNFHQRAAAVQAKANRSLKLIKLFWIP